MFNKIQRFSIRKLAIGAASVAIGTFFVGMNNSQQVFADTTATASESSQGARTNEPAATDSKQEIKPSTETKEETTRVRAQENVKAVSTNKDVETKTITRTIYDNANAPSRIDGWSVHLKTITQTVTFERTKTTDDNGKTIYGDWQAKDGKDSWDEYLPQGISKDKLASTVKVPMLPVYNIKYANGECKFKGMIGIL